MRGSTTTTPQYPSRKHNRAGPGIAFEQRWTLTTTHTRIETMITSSFQQECEDHSGSRSLCLIFWWNRPTWAVNRLVALAFGCKRKQATAHSSHNTQRTDMDVPRPKLSGNTRLSLYSGCQRHPIHSYLRGESPAAPSNNSRRIERTCWGSEPAS